VLVIEDANISYNTHSYDNFHFASDQGEQTMKKFYTCLSLLAILFFVPLLGTIVGWRIGTSKDERVMTDQLNKPWREIKGPFRFTKMLAADPGLVWAQTSYGRIYTRNVDCSDPNEECARWELVKAVPEYLYEEEGDWFLEKGETCPGINEIPQKPPSPIIQCALVEGFPDMYYVLLDDGTIWYWSTPVGNDLGYEVYFAFIGFWIGGVVGAIVILVISKKVNNFFL
jgi:hypothetical protein